MRLPSAASQQRHAYDTEPAFSEQRRHAFVRFQYDSSPTRKGSEDATPVPDAVALLISYPAGIHVGTCDDLRPAPVFPLADVVLDGPLGGTPPALEVLGADTAIPVAMSVTAIDVPLDDILAGDHAVNVALSAEHLDESLDCGDIGGRMIGEKLVVGLQEQDTSGATGIAWLSTAAEDQTTVTIFVAQGLAADVPAPTVATPAPEEIEVATPPPVEIEPATPPPDEVEVATPPPDEEAAEATPAPDEETVVGRWFRLAS